MRDPQASESFNLLPGQEFDRVTTAADADSDWMGQLVRFLGYSGAHISVLSGGYRRHLVHYEDHDELELLYQEPLDSTAVRGGFIFWRRPKNQKQIGMPVSRHLEEWVREFLDAPRPRSRQRYNQLLYRVGVNAAVHVNPLRFRHSCGVRLMHIHGLSSAEVEKLLGVTPATVATYIARPQWMVAKHLLETQF